MPAPPERTAPTLAPATSARPPTTVREATFDVWRRYELTTIFSNPGSTEIPLLGDLPGDLRFVLGLHEATVVGMATGFALATGRPALAVVHTTAGLGNAIGALATAYENRAALVVVAGQQDRRHLAFEPFLAGKLVGLGGDYLAWTCTPARADDVPGAMARAWHEASSARGPALVVVPMDDWSRPWGATEIPAPARLAACAAPDPRAVEDLAGVLAASRSPVLVVGADADGGPEWKALARLADVLDTGVWQEAFGARAGFAQDHRRFMGHLPAERARLRSVLAVHDVVLVVGAPVLRQYPYSDGPLVEPGTRVLQVVRDARDAHHSPAELSVVGDVALLCDALADRLAATRSGHSPAPGDGRRSAADEHVTREGPGPLDTETVLAEIARRLPHDAIVVEEAPSARPALHRLVPARHPLGFVSAAMGGLGFAMPAAVGLSLALPGRRVVAIVGDGSSLYAIQSLWSATRERVDVVFVVLRNGRYAVMDRLAERHGATTIPWPAFEDLDLAAICRAMGCDTRVVRDATELRRDLDDVVGPRARRGRGPVVLEVHVAVDTTFEP